ncbi:MAG: class I SAM-dependent methyltransferase [Emcibacter sp.]|nr:class I SAM-dependent methyltransferase [Emcibacter sp.]
MTRLKTKPLMFALAASFLCLSTPAYAQMSVTMKEAPQNHQMSPMGQSHLKDTMANGHRSDRHKQRDIYRHPVETLSFFGLEPHMTVAEIWPGGQDSWYRSILAPYLAPKGHYIPVTKKSGFPQSVKDLPYGEVDMVMVFRAHGFIMYDDPAQDHVNAIFSMLKPGGIMTIVDHAGDEAIPQDPKGKNGYINESHFLTIAAKAGFKLLAESDINRNPKDDKNHPRGVWSLPPTLSGSLPFTDKRAAFLKIGESDRFTLKFYKPE